MPVASRLVDPASLDDLLLYRLSRLLATAGTIVIRLCEGRYGITRREWRILALLAEEEGLLSSQLAQRAQLDRARTSRAVTSLASKKLLRREPRARDRRQTALVLTDAGRAVHASLFPQVQQINRDLLAALGGADVPRLERMIARLQRQADAMVLDVRLPKADRRRGRDRVRRAMG